MQYSNIDIEKINEISKIMLSKTQMMPADLIIVFGTTYGIDLFVENIVSLYKKGFCKYILCTGGNVVRYTQNSNEMTYKESILMKKLLIKDGIPENKILVETESKNTGDNLKFSIPILNDVFGNINNIKSIIGVGKIHGTLRFLMTMCKYFPKSKKMFFPINVFGCDENLWYLNDKFYNKLMMEVEKIKEYMQKGFIAELDDNALLK